jgi:hypothetical protein
MRLQIAMEHSLAARGNYGETDCIFEWANFISCQQIAGDYDGKA